MANKVFKLVAACVMLLLYVSAFAAGNVISLTCQCSHHKADVHTAFNHVHVCDHTHSHSHDCGEHECSSEQGTIIADKTCCNHNHSNSIVLYTQPRSLEDDSAERQMLVVAVVTDVLNFVEAEGEESIPLQYGDYLVAPPSAGHTDGSALRAPPVFV